MTVRYCPYQGVKKMRYLFMAEHLPEQLRELKRQGMPAHQHLKQPGNWDPWFKGLKMAEHQAEEIAIRNVVEAL